MINPLVDEIDYNATAKKIKGGVTRAVDPPIYWMINGFRRKWMNIKNEAILPIFRILHPFYTFFEAYLDSSFKYLCSDKR